MQPESKVVDAWLQQARSIDLVTEGDRNAQGIGNMLAFVGVAALSSERVGATLEAIADVYEKKAATAGARGLFYAWADEMAFQLRCSFCCVDDVSDLPFACILREVPAAASLAEQAVVALAQPDPNVEPPDAPEPPEPYELDVWCTRLPRPEETRRAPLPSDARSGEGSPSGIVWIFAGSGGRGMTSGVFWSLEEASAWIAKHTLTGLLTEFPVGVGAWDFAVANGNFRVKREEHRAPGFIGSFSNPGLRHFHFEEGMGG